MNFSLKKLGARKELEAKSFPDGGLNTKEPENKIGDNESGKMLNFCLKDGVLTLRPGLVKKIAFDYGKIIDIYPKNGKALLLSRIYPVDNTTLERRGIYIATEKAILYYDGVSVNPVFTLEQKDGKTVKTAAMLSLYSGALIPTGGAKKESFELNCVTYKIQGENILFIGSGKFYSISPQRDTTVEDKIAVIPVISEVVPKVPVLYEKCDASGEGKRLGGHNILTDRVEQYFNTDKTSLRYNLCDRELNNDPIIVTYTCETGMQYQYIFKSIDVGKINDDIQVSVDRRDGFIEFSAPLCDSKACGISNNLQVSYAKTSTLRESLLNCSVGEWFNGGAKSSSGNGRLFLSGNDRDPNRIFCSVANDPSYFPDDAGFLVGRPNEKITALHTIGSFMIIFMENSIFSLNFAQLLDVSDFILKEISSTIGCEIPKTIAKIGNFLVFAQKDKVYSLSPSKISSAKSLMVISEKIANELSKISGDERISASSAFDGKDYLLFMGKNVFALATTKSDFSLLDGKVAWFLYKVPYSLENAFTLEDGIAAFCDNEIYEFSQETTDDCGKAFDAYVFSKVYDFEIFDFYKRITLAQVASKGDNQAEFSFVINLDGEEKEKTVKLSNVLDRESIFTVVPLYNRVNTACIGIRRKLECNKKFSIGGLYLRALKTSPQR